MVFLWEKGDSQSGVLLHVPAPQPGRHRARRGNRGAAHGVRDREFTTALPPTTLVVRCASLTTSPSPTPRAGTIPESPCWRPFSARPRSVEPSSRSKTGVAPVLVFKRFPTMEVYHYRVGKTGVGVDFLHSDSELLG